MFQFNYLKLLEKHIYSSDPQQSGRSRFGGQNIHSFSSLIHFIIRFVGILNAITCVREMADIKKARSITQSAYSSYTTQEEEV